MTGPAPAPPGAGARPQYSPDGRWYWTSTEWITAGDVFLRRPVGPAPLAAPIPQRPGWRAALAAILVLLLLAAAVVGILARAPTFNAPAASRVFALPFADHVASAAVSGTLAGDGITDQVTGTLELAPDRALHLTLRLGGQYVGEYLDSGGLGYETQQSGGPWQAQTSLSLIDQDLGWSGGPPPPGLRVSGQDVVAGEPAWHLLSSSGGAWWIGVNSGHPLRFTYESAQYDLSLTFSDFGGQAPVTAPPSGDVSTRYLHGATHTIVTAPEMSMEVDVVQPTVRALGTPPSGFHYEAIYLAWENDSAQSVTFDNAFTLTGAHGAQYASTTAVEMTPVLSADEQLLPGQLVSGWDVFVVADDAQGLTLREGPEGDEQNLDFLLSIPLT